VQAFWFLAVLIALPVPIMLMVDVERGKAEGMALARELEELSKAPEEREDVVPPEDLIDGMDIQREHEERY
jgi:UMF1 family MFS transporter